MNSNHINFENVLPWLKYCKKDHEICRLSKRPLLPTWVIDCARGEVVPAPEHCDYATLSYVWGNSPDDSHVTSDGLLVNAPATIRDALTVTLALGYRYIWIDRYCINQNDSAEKLAQIHQMGHIYRASTITLFAVAGTGPQHGLPGVGETSRYGQMRKIVLGREMVGLLDKPRDLIKGSVWASRA
jgi:hypothetical protein